MYSYKNKKGDEYYLHNKGKLFYFSRDKKSAIDLPSQFKTVENPKTGLPCVKKK